MFWSSFVWFIYFGGLIPWIAHFIHHLFRFVELSFVVGDCVPEKQLATSCVGQESSHRTTAGRKPDQVSSVSNLCVCACVRACVHACMHECVCVWVRVGGCNHPNPDIHGDVYFRYFSVLILTIPSPHFQNQRTKHDPPLCEPALTVVCTVIGCNSASCCRK